VPLCNRPRCGLSGFSNLSELHHASHSALGPLFSELAQTHGSVRAVLADPGIGRILLDDSQDPGAGLIWGPEGLYLGGAPRAGGDYASLSSAIEGWAYLYVSPAWKPALSALLPGDYRVPHARIRLLALAPPRCPKPLPQDYLITPMAEPLGFAVTHEGQIVSRCSADMIVGHYAEIGVWTHFGHRRKGLARAAAAASLGAAFESGIEEVGWHCLASNKGSLAVADALGLSFEQPYTAFSASLPAENVGDLSASECRQLAVHFDAGAKHIHWLGFHAAAAWALAGEEERALDAVEALIAGAWSGEVSWLQTHWALQKLQGEPRFKAAIGQLKAAMKA